VSFSTTPSFKYMGKNSFHSAWSVPALAQWQDDQATC
jgi:hypothetical protein